MFTNEGFERGRREAFETRERIEKRDRIEREAASAQRERLERASPDCARRNFAGILNGLTADGPRTNGRAWTPITRSAGGSVRPPDGRGPQRG